MDEILNLTSRQLDALREVANIGAGHAATALSGMTGGTILVSVPRIKIVRIEDIATEFGSPDVPVAAVIMAITGDLGGSTMLVFRKEAALVLASMLTPRALGVEGELTKIGESAIKETGNIVGGAYLSALSEFLGMKLLPSPPDMAIDMAGAILVSAESEFGSEHDYVFCVESEFVLRDGDARLRGIFLLMPDRASLKSVLDVLRVA